MTEIAIRDLPIDIESVDQIFHVADVHIRNLRRHDEYREVFEKLYDDIARKITENSLIAVLGDIAHAKTEMSPELVVMISEFLTELARIGPTIVIPGNHDANLRNSFRLDSLTPIINALDNPNIHYLKDTALFRVGNVVMSHMSIFTEVDDYIPASEIPDEYVKVAMYHGTVDRSTTDFGFVLSNNKVDQHTFVGYDVVLLGDIHKRQNVSTYNIEELVVDESELESYIKSGWELVGVEDYDDEDNDPVDLPAVEEPSDDQDDGVVTTSNGKFW